MSPRTFIALAIEQRRGALDEAHLVADLAEGGSAAGLEPRSLGSRAVLVAVARGASTLNAWADHRVACQRVLTDIRERLHGKLRIVLEPVALPVSAELARDLLEEAMSSAADRLFRLNGAAQAIYADSLSCAGLAASVTCALFLGTSLVLAHVGDGHAYLWRGGTLERLSPPCPSLIGGSLPHDGELAALFESERPLRQTRAQRFGPARSVRPQTAIRALQHGDRVLLHTDGLRLEEAATSRTLETTGALDEAARALMTTDGGGGQATLALVEISLT